MSSTAIQTRMSPTSSPTPPPYSQASAVRTDSIDPTPKPANGMTSLDEKHKPQPQRPKYKISVPINQLGRFSVPTDCPVCGQRNLTTLAYKICGTTHGTAIALLSCTVVLFWVPYLLRSMKNVEHHCGNTDCGVKLGTWHRSGTGGTEVHQFETTG